MLVLSPVSLAPAGLLFRFADKCAMTAVMDGHPITDADRRRGELVALLGAVGGGDQAAFAALYDRTSAKLYGVCVRLLGQGPEADEVLQDVYVTVWRKAERFDAGKASPITWLAVIARNKAIDRLRSRRMATDTIDHASEVADDRPSALDLIEESQDRDRLTACVEELDDRPQAMIRAAFLDGCTYSSLASREDVPLGTMKSWIRRALIKLRECLER